MVRHPDALVRIVRAPGEIGLARAWVSGELDVDGDLEDAVARTEDWRHAPLRPADALVALRVGRRLGLLRRPEPPPPAIEARLGGDRHSAARDAAAIRHHYDVSNAFYRRMLGPTMVYSCAYFASADDTLEEAQTRKLDLVCRKLELQPGRAAAGHRLRLGLAAPARRVRVRRARRRRDALASSRRTSRASASRRRAWRDRIEIRVQDYREVADGPYDKIASIGMFEHVGRANLPRYFAQARGAAAARRACSSTTGSSARRDAGADLGAFSERYVFPDGELHTQGDRHRRARGRPASSCCDDESLRPHYAETLRRWAANHEAHREEAIAEIGAERERVWRLHNVGAALGFERGRLSVHQVLVRPLGGVLAAPAAGALLPGRRQRRRAAGSSAGFVQPASVGLTVVPGGTISSMRSSTASSSCTSARAELRLELLHRARADDRRRHRRVADDEREREVDQSRCRSRRPAAPSASAASSFAWLAGIDRS